MFGAPVLLDPGLASAPPVVVDGAGVATVVWPSDRRNEPTHVLTGPIGGHATRESVRGPVDAGLAVAPLGRTFLFGFAPLPRSRERGHLVAAFREPGRSFGALRRIARVRPDLGAGAIADDGTALLLWKHGGLLRRGRLRAVVFDPRAVPGRPRAFGLPVAQRPGFSPKLVALATTTRLFALWTQRTCRPGGGCRQQLRLMTRRH
jgi:hypothetical protein